MRRSPSSTHSLIAAVAILVSARASAQEWRFIPAGTGPAIRRQEGLIVDQEGDRLVVAGGENSDGRTWALDLSGPATWVDLGIAVPADATDITRAVYDVRDRKMILVTFSLAVYALDLSAPGQWTLISPSGSGPTPRRFPAIAYDSLRNRLLVFGGGPDTGIFGDTWALSLTGPPIWEQISAQGPAPRWAAVAVYDDVNDRLVVATGSGSDGGRLNDVWALSLSSPSTWQQLHPTGALPAARYLSAAAFARGSHKLVLFGGHNGAQGMNDVWSLDLSDPTDWRQQAFVDATPDPLWSHMLVYREAHPEVITYGGWDGSNYRSEVWGLGQEPDTGPPAVFGFSPLGGRAGDAITITGARLASPTEVRIGGATASVVSSTFSSIHTTVPAGAVTGPISVTTADGTATSDRDFFVGEPPEVASFTPDSGRSGQEVEIHGNHLASTVRVSFGGTGSAALGEITDTVIHAVVDTLASSGSIVVTTLVGSATSADRFQVLPDDPRPHLLSVRDVARDQGGKVLLRWSASGFDQPRYRKITGYRVWRRAPLTDLAAPASAAARPAGDPGAAPDVFWENIAELPAAFLQGYAFAAPTFSDSSETGNPYTAFFVQAISADPFVFYNSSPDSGYSVDNIPPHPPFLVAVTYEQAANRLSWHPVPTADVHGYELYRGSSVAFTPSAATWIASVTETTYADAPGSFYYKLAAIDTHGNQSRFITVAPDVPAGTLAALVRAERTAAHVKHTWSSSGNAGLQAHVQRRTPITDWTTLGTITADSAGVLRHDDGSVDAGTRYAYRLAVLDDEDGSEESFTTESWVEPLTAPRLALALGANPSVDGRVRLVLTLPAAAHAEVSLFDLAGREIERRAIETGRNGSLEMTLGTPSTLRPGVYLVRAVSGAVRVTKRVAVIL